MSSIKDRLLALLHRGQPAADGREVTEELLREIAAYLDSDQPDQAAALARQTANPMTTGLAALRYTS